MGRDRSSSMLMSSSSNLYLTGSRSGMPLSAGGGTGRSAGWGSSMYIDEQARYSSWNANAGSNQRDKNRSFSEGEDSPLHSQTDAPSTPSSRGTSSFYRPSPIINASSQHPSQRQQFPNDSRASLASSTSPSTRSFSHSYPLPSAAGIPTSSSRRSTLYNGPQSLSTPKQPRISSAPHSVYMSIVLPKPLAKPKGTGVVSRDYRTLEFSNSSGVRSGSGEVGEWFEQGETRGARGEEREREREREGRLNNYNHRDSERPGLGHFAMSVNERRSRASHSRSTTGSRSIIDRDEQDRLSNRSGDGNDNEDGNGTRGNYNKRNVSYPTMILPPSPPSREEEEVERLESFQSKRT
jgi:hypothetical protein